MRTIAVASARATTRVGTIAAPQAFYVWFIPILYPLSLSATFRSAELARADVALGSGFLALAIAWSVSGPVAAWLAPNYLDRNELDRKPKPVGGTWRIARRCYAGAIHRDAADQQ